MRYIEIINDLEVCLNFRSTNELKAKHNKQVFNSCLVALKDDFKTDVSTKFLMGFVKGDDKQKSNRVSYMLKQIGLKDRLRITNSYMESVPTTTAKECEVLLYKSRIDKNENEHISLKVIPMTSHTPHYKKLDNGKIVNMGMIKAPCKVGITSRKLKQITLNQIPL